jgi:hypothetical protein
MRRYSGCNLGSTVEGLMQRVTELLLDIVRKATWCWAMSRARQPICFSLSIRGLLFVGDDANNHNLLQQGRPFIMRLQQPENRAIIQG